MCSRSGWRELRESAALPLNPKKLLRRQYPLIRGHDCRSGRIPGVNLLPKEWYGKRSEGEPSAAAGSRFPLSSVPRTGRDWLNLARGWSNLNGRPGSDSGVNVIWRAWCRVQLLARALVPRGGRNRNSQGPGVPSPGHLMQFPVSRPNLRADAQGDVTG